jgi:surface polysaccharide O-acyltransferase-like enzyme
MGVLALALRFATQRQRILDSLSQNAYGMYLVHYVFVVWLQYAMLGVLIPAIVKVAIVFTGTLLMSWAATAALRSIPFGSRLIGDDGRALAKAS